MLDDMSIARNRRDSMVTRTRQGESGGRARRGNARTGADDDATLIEEMQAAAAAATETGDKAVEEGARARRNGPGRARRAAGSAARTAARTAVGAIQGPDGLFEDAGSVGTAVAVGIAAAVIESELIPGILIGAGAILLGRIFPSVAAGLRPVAKSVIRAGMVMTDKAREVAAETGEQMRDLVAEAQAERERGRRERPRARRRAAAPAEAAAV